MLGCARFSAMRDQGISILLGLGRVITPITPAAFIAFQRASVDEACAARAPGLPGALAAHASSTEARWKAMKAAGVIGVITLPNPSNMDIPWSRMALNRAHPSMALADPEFNHTAGEKLAAYFNPAHADKLFAGSGHSFDELLKLAKEQKPLPHFPLAVSIRSNADVQQRELTSNNIVAK